MGRYIPHRGPWIKAIHQVKGIHQHANSVLLGGLHLFAHSLIHILHPRVISEPKVLRLGRDGVVDLHFRE